MKSILRITALMGVSIITYFLTFSMVSAYEEGTGGKTVVEGKITFKGTSPPPKLFDLAKFSQPLYCGKVDSDGKGHRILREVTVNNGNLQDVVVYIQNITKGKPFTFNGTDVKIDHCRFLVQDGPSTFVGVVVKDSEIRVLNEDIDPSDPTAEDGVLHNPHGYEFYQFKNWSMFNKPVPTKGQVLKEKIIFQKHGSYMRLECDQHNFEQAWFYPVENPYYAIVGSTGTYSIDLVPAGRYKLIAWHPILGTMEKEIEVGTTDKVTANFEFSK